MSCPPAFHVMKAIDPKVPMLNFPLEKSPAYHTDHLFPSKRDGSVMETTQDNTDTASAMQSECGSLLGIHCLQLSLGKLEGSKKSTAISAELHHIIILCKAQQGNCTVSTQQSENQQWRFVS